MAQDPDRPQRVPDRRRPGWRNHLRRAFYGLFHPHPEGQKPNKQQVGAHAGYWFAAFIVIMILQSLFAARQAVQSIPHSQFLTLLDQKKIASVQVEGSSITGTLKEAENGRKLFETTAVP